MCPHQCSKSYKLLLFLSLLLSKLFLKQLLITESPCFNYKLKRFFLHFVQIFILQKLIKIGLYWFEKLFKYEEVGEKILSVIVISILFSFSHRHQILELLIWLIKDTDQRMWSHTHPPIENVLWRRFRAILCNFVTIVWCSEEWRRISLPLWYLQSTSVLQYTN